MPKRDSLDLGHPLWRDVFNKIMKLVDAFVALDAAVERKVTPDDEIGYTIGRFLRTTVAKRDPVKIDAIPERVHARHLWRIIGRLILTYMSLSAILKESEGHDAKRKSRTC